MNKILIVDASVSDGRIITGLLVRADYDPIVTDCIETGKVEAAKTASRRGYRHCNAIVGRHRKNCTTFFNLNLNIPLINKGVNNY